MTVRSRSVWTPRTSQRRAANDNALFGWISSALSPAATYVTFAEGGGQEGEERDGVVLLTGRERRSSGKHCVVLQRLRERTRDPDPRNRHKLAHLLDCQVRTSVKQRRSSKPVIDEGCPCINHFRQPQPVQQLRKSTPRCVRSVNRQRNGRRRASPRAPRS